MKMSLTKCFLDIFQRYLEDISNKISFQILQDLDVYWDIIKLI